MQSPMAVDAASEAGRRATRLTEQRRGLPDQPGVYLFRDERGRVIYVGKAKSIRKRVASHFSNPTQYGTRALTDEVDHIESLAVATEAEALLTEQTFIKQYKPRFNIRLRDDKSYPYIAISLDEDFPRVYFTRERHRRDRAYFGPYSSAKRVRGTLDLLGKVFLFRSCEGPEPGRHSGSPCLDYYIKRCGAPCVGYVSKEEYREGIDGVMAFLSGRFKEIERDLERRMYFHAGEQDFEQATIERNRLQAVRALLERQRVANEGAGTYDAVAVAVDGTEANAQVFQVRDGVLSDRQSFYLDNQAEQAPAMVAEEFVLQYYASALSIPSLIVVQGELAEGSELDDPRRDPRPSAAAARSRSAPPSAAASAGSSSWPSATRGSRSTRRSSRPSAAASSASTRSRASRRRSGWTRCRCGSSASTSRTSAAPTRPRRWSSSRAARRRSRIIEDSTSARSSPATITAPWRRCSRAGTRSGSARTSAPRTTPTATRRSPRCRTSS